MISNVRLESLMKENTSYESLVHSIRSHMDECPDRDLYFVPKYGRLYDHEPLLSNTHNNKLLDGWSIKPEYDDLVNMRRYENEIKYVYYGGLVLKRFKDCKLLSLDERQLDSFKKNLGINIKSSNYDLIVHELMSLAEGIDDDIKDGLLHSLVLKMRDGTYVYIHQYEYGGKIIEVFKKCKPDSFKILRDGVKTFQEEHIRTKDESFLSFLNTCVSDVCEK